MDSCAAPWVPHIYGELGFARLAASLGPPRSSAENRPTSGKQYESCQAGWSNQTQHCILTLHSCILSQAPLRSQSFELIVRARASDLRVLTRRHRMADLVTPPPTRRGAKRSRRDVM